MTDNNDQHAGHPVQPDGALTDVTELGKRVIAMDPRKTLIDYSGLNFKEMFLACPIDDIDLSRNIPNPENPINPDSDNHRPPGASGGLAATAISPARNTATAKNVNGIR